MNRRVAGCSVAVVLVTLVLAATALPVPAVADDEEFACGTEAFETPEELLARGVGMPSAVASSIRRPGVIPPNQGACMTPEHLVLVEDSDGFFASPDQDGAELIRRMSALADALIAEHGDSFDFIGFWTAFAPQTRFGGAFFSPVQNDVLGIGRPLFDFHEERGIRGTRLQGMVMMYDLFDPGGHITRNALAHEFAHRWMFYFRDLPDGRRLQRGAHSDCRVDNQGGAMTPEWTGETPAVSGSSYPNDDTGQRFSPLTLYAAGYLSADELDSLSSELRYLDFNPACESPYQGFISDFGSAELVASNGPRVPSSADSQKHYRSAWIVIHEPGQPPTRTTQEKLVRLLEYFSNEWQLDTLGRGTMDLQLFPDADCDGVPDAE